MTYLTPLYEILIYLEDKGNAHPDEIKKWGTAVSRGVLGKMEAMGLVSKEISTLSETTYSLSKKGYSFLNSILDALHQNISHWDLKWRFVWFSVPETRRPQRDKLRRYLEAIGFRPVLNGVWASPFDQTDSILKKAGVLGVEKNILTVEAQQIGGLNQEDLLRYWDFDTTRKAFEEFILRSNLVIESREKTRFELKKLIFEFAIIANNEPKLPIELLPKDWPKFRAQLQYRKLKRLIG